MSDDSPVPPMIPTEVGPFHRDGWVYEEKVDGWLQGRRDRALTTRSMLQGLIQPERLGKEGT